MTLLTRRRGRDDFQPTRSRPTASIVNEGMLTHGRVRSTLYGVLIAFCCNFALQAWYAQQTERRRQAENAAIELVAVQRMLSQRIARLAFAPMLLTAPEQHQEFTAAIQRSDTEFQRFAEKFAALGLGSPAENPELIGALGNWQTQRTDLILISQALLDSAGRRESAAIERLAAAVGDRADEALVSVQALLDAMQAAASNGHESRIRQSHISAALNLALLTLLAVLAIEPAVRSARRQYRRLATQAMDLQRLALVAERTTNAVVLVDDSRCVSWVNHAFTRITGIPSCNVVGRGLVEVLSPMADDCEPMARLIRSLEAGAGDRFQMRRKSSDGTESWLDLDIQSLQDDDGSSRGHVSVATDITELKQAQSDLRIAAIAFDSLGGIAVTGQDQRILRVNEAFTRITGYSADEALGSTTAELLRSGRHDRSFYEAMWTSLNRDHHWQGEIWNRRKNGEIYPQWLSISSVHDEHGRTTNFVAVFTDITEKKRADETIRTLAYFDPLTKLPNRRLLRERISEAISESARSGQFAALLFIDLDNFKELNDSKGHDVGDLLLLDVAKRLSSGVRADDTVARQGGDEFVVLVSHLSSDPIQAGSKAETIAETIRYELNRPYLLGSFQYHSSPSIGVSVFLGAEHSVDELLKRADSAMYLAKRSGRNTFRFFDPAMHEARQQRVELEADLRKALGLGQLVLHFQPQVDVRGCVRGAEILLRWNHATRGSIPPNLFIPLAEETDLILDIGKWVLERAALLLVAWSSRPVLSEIDLAVNVSARQFRRSDFAETVSDVLTRTGLDADRLKLELTESLILSDVEEVVATMNAVRDLGVKLSVDDFGTGQSSLSYLTRLPLDQLKIDQSFVHNLSQSRPDAIVVQTIIGLAENLGFKVIAEGVETQEQRTLLESMGCLMYQGYYFGRPMPLDHFEALVESTACPVIQAADQLQIVATKLA